MTRFITIEALIFYHQWSTLSSPWKDFDELESRIKLLNSPDEAIRIMSQPPLIGVNQSYWRCDTLNLKYTMVRLSLFGVWLLSHTNTRVPGEKKLMVINTYSPRRLKARLQHHLTLRKQFPPHPTPRVWVPPRPTLRAQARARLTP
jgi:hypothetical protein